MKRSRQWTRRLGIGLMLGSIGAMVLATGPAAAQDAPEPVEVTVQSTALFSSPATDAIPATLTNGFPPRVVCVLFAQACPEEAEPLTTPLGDALDSAQEQSQPAPVQPVPPDTIAVAYMGGHVRYQSAVKFSLPTVPDGQDIDSFVLALPQSDPSYSVDSPAFRQAVLAAIALAGEQDPAAFQEEFTKALEDDPYSNPQIGIEACPFTKAFPDTPPPQTLTDDDLPREDQYGQQVIAVDCLYGTNGVFDDASQTWTFDLTYAAKAWADGTLENHGILLRPTGAPNLAFGDADTSTNAQVALDVGSAPKVTQETSAPPPPPAPFTPAPSQSQPQSQPTTASQPQQTAPPPARSEPVSTSLFSAPEPQPAAAEPAPAQVAPEQSAPVAAPAPAAALDQVPAAADGSFPWVWLLVPVFGAGMWLTAQSLTAEVAAEPVTRGGGALSRLVDRATPQNA